jgi:NADH-quinone oxidoreductase subunit J
MELTPILFWAFAAMAVVGGLLAVLLPRIVHAVFALMLTFVGVAAIYVMAGADFLGITQIVVYVGGVLVLLAFGILLTGRTAAILGEREVRHRTLGVLLGGLLFGGLLAAVLATPQFDRAPTPVGEGTTEGLGALLLGDYIVAFEFASVLLLIALMGAAYLVRRERA